MNAVLSALMITKKEISSEFYPVLMVEYLKIYLKHVEYVNLKAYFDVISFEVT